MATYRVQIGFHLDSALPKDMVTINPHYEGDNPQALGDALKANLIAVGPIANTVPFSIKVYDAKKLPPSYPLYSTSNGTGFYNTSRPREVALCLSYYAGFNRPTYRGRMYLPAAFISGGLDLRPTSTQMAQAVAWKTTLGKNLPSNHYWCLYSRKNKSSASVDHVWCDDEWDTVRSRGLKGTTRLLETLA